MPTLTITGVDEAVARFVAERARALHFEEGEYLASLIHEDMARIDAERRDRLDRIVGPLHAHSEAQGYTDEFLADLFARAREEAARARE